MHSKSENQLVVIDPVLGDNGKMYGPISIEMVSEMRSLIQKSRYYYPEFKLRHLYYFDEPFHSNNQ